MLTSVQPPLTKDALHELVHDWFDISVPRYAVAAGNTSPFDYLCHSFFDGASSWNEQPPAHADCVVWANRGGGKTYLGAIATAMDLVFKPGIRLCILGGSREQSHRMYDYLRDFFEKDELRDLLPSPLKRDGGVLSNGSRVEILSQSHRSVRGRRVHKLRCDEVEEFDRDIWQAAQLITRSGWCGGRRVPGTIEALSTMHRTHGLMRKLTDSKDPNHSSCRVFRWNVLDVMEQCEPQRDCGGCPLWGDCGGRAKDAAGFVMVDDAINQWRRTDDNTWASEMMCHRPTRSACVYPMFDEQKHVRTIPVIRGEDKSDPVNKMEQHRNPAIAGKMQAFGTIIGGVDFGLRSPFVMLWAQMRGRGDEARIEVFDEYIAGDRTLDEHAKVILERGWPRPKWIGVDPAGRQRSSHTKLTDIDVLRGYDLTIRTRDSKIKEGIAAVRRWIDRGQLVIDPRCGRLIEAMTCYHFDVHDPASETPIKDGPDHACDALRYMVINVAQCSTVQRRGY